MTEMRAVAENARALALAARARGSRRMLLGPADVLALANAVLLLDIPGPDWAAAEEAAVQAVADADLDPQVDATPDAYAGAAVRAVRRELEGEAR